MSIRQPRGMYMGEDGEHRPVYTYGTQRPVVLVKEAWKKLADYLNVHPLPEDIHIIRFHILMQTGLLEEEQNVHTDGET
jgi:hypothetical protein